MKNFICDACGHTYAKGVVIGKPDPACSKNPAGVIRELTVPERIWINRYNDLHRGYTRQAKEIRHLRESRLGRLTL